MEQHAMKPERWQQIERLYNAVLELEPGRREAFLKEACVGDESLHREVVSLLACQPEAEGLLESPALEAAARALTQDRKDKPQPNYVGRALLHYRIIERIGEGGMGVVYKAHDTHLDRTVAIKILPAEAATNSGRKQRFIKEAKAASNLNHPNIIDIHDININSDDGVLFIVMEYVAGKTLDRYIGREGLQIGEALRYAVQIADALATAHAAGVVHRDLKPTNVMVTETGLIKILDFGLAKLTRPFQSELSGTVSSMESLTGEGQIIGTVAYMSPEQAGGKPVDARSDIFTFGAVLYEMVTGRRAFKGDSNISTLAAIVHGEPEPVSSLAAEIPQELERVITHCLKKNPEDRFQHMRGTKLALEELKDSLGFSSRGRVETKGLWGILGRKVFVIPGLIVIAVLGYLAVTGTLQNRRVRWAREIALPNAQQLLAKDDWVSAYAVAVEAEKYIASDPQLMEVFSETAILLSVKTDPSGAEVFLKPYASADDRWLSIGRTPVKARRVSRGFKEYAITKAGYGAVTGFTGSDQRLGLKPADEVRLDRTLAVAGTIPPGMVRVDGGEYKPTIPYFRSLDEVDLDAFFIEEYETTNRQYQAFVDAGGYRDKKYWKHEFIKDGKKFALEEAITAFTDKTGRNAPLNWELGHFPEGQEDYPVSGISWYEAAAYAEFAHEMLPTVYHWNKAAGAYDLSDSAPGTSMIRPMVKNSNFGDAGPAPVGKYRGVSPFGAFDMAGNLGEWIWNGAAGGKYLLGGSWGTSEYLFYGGPVLLSPFDRSPTNGFRCVRLPGSHPLPAATLADVPVQRSDVLYQFGKPVSEDVFRIYAGYYSYDKTPLKPVAETLDESSPYHIRQRVTFDAAYGNERVVAYLFFPRNAKPPYQTVIKIPGDEALAMRSIEEYPAHTVSIFTRSGRAFVFPVYKGTFERKPVMDISTPTRDREFRVTIYRDLARTIDYLETRPEFDCGKLAMDYLSGWDAPIYGALEKRIKLFLLEGVGLMNPGLPEINPVNFAPRHMAPTVILNGRYDIGLPVEMSAKPMLELLGTPNKDKELILFDSGHAPPMDSKLKKSILDWLDRYLGPVQ